MPGRNNWAKLTYDGKPNRTLSESVTITFTEKTDRLISFKQACTESAQEIFDTYKNLYVSEIYKLINTLFTKLAFISNIKEAFIIIAAIGFNCLLDVISILTLIKLLNNSINNLFINNKKYNDQDRELELLFDIIIKFKKKFKYFIIFNINSLEDLYNINKKIYYKLCNEFIKIHKENMSSSTFGAILFNKMKISYENGVLFDINTYKNLLNMNSILTEAIFEDFLTFSSEIEEWCINNNIKYTIFDKFLNNYTKNTIDILTISKNTETDILEVSVIDIIKEFTSNFTKILDNSSPYEKIIRSFIFGYPLQYGFKIDNSKYYFTYNNYKIINKYPNNAFCLIYLYGEDNNNSNIINISLTNKIKLSWLVNALPFYFNKDNFKNIYLNYTNNNLEIKEVNSYNWDLLCKQITEINSSNVLLDIHKKLQNNNLLKV